MHTEQETCHTAPTFVIRASESFLEVRNELPPLLRRHRSGIQTLGLKPFSAQWITQQGSKVQNLQSKRGPMFQMLMHLLKQIAENVQ